MLRIALLRHAKSSWAEPGLLDINRPLNARGKAAAPVMGSVLASLNFAPDAILCSPAARTRETLALLLPELPERSGGAVDAVFEDDLYLAEPGDLLARLRALPETVKSVLVVGHNPGLHELAARCAASGDIGQITKLHGAFPTAGLALISFDQTAFKDLDPHSGHLETFVTPKDRA